MESLYYRRNRCETFERHHFRVRSPPVPIIWKILFSRLVLLPVGFSQLVAADSVDLLIDEDQRLINLNYCQTPFHSHKIGGLHNIIIANRPNNIYSLFERLTAKYCLISCICNDCSVIFWRKTMLFDVESGRRVDKL